MDRISSVTWQIVDKSLQFNMREAYQLINVSSPRISNLPTFVTSARRSAIATK
jgi:hypothetical protein